MDTKLYTLTIFYIFEYFANGLPSSMPHIISHHFLGVDGIQLYVCERRDAVTIMRSFFNEPRLLSTKLVNAANSSRDIQFNFMQPQVLGIFVDLSCDKGIYFLNESSTKFNASYKWLFWTTNYNMLLTLLRPTRVRTDSNVAVAIPAEDNTVRVLDLFRMHVSLPFTVTQVEKWYNNGTYVHMNNPPERNNFEGAVIPATLLLVLMDFDFSQNINILLDVTYMPGLDGGQRYGLSIFLHIAEIFNITYSYTWANTWGYQLENGSWTGMMNHLQTGVSEVALYPAQMRFGREKIVDYLMTLYVPRFIFTFKQPKLFGSYKALMLPFSYEVWICILIVVIIGATILRIMAYYDKTALTNDNWSGSIFLVLAALSQQGLPDNSVKTPTRLFYFFFLFCTYFTFLYYSISILSGLLLPSPNAIQNMDQLLASDIRLGVQDNPYFRFEMETWNDTLTKRVRQKLNSIRTPDKVYYSMVEGVEEIKKGHFALYNADVYTYDFIAAALTGSEIASLTEIEKDPPTYSGALVMDNCPYKELFRRKLLMMRERGITDCGKSRWFAKKPYSNWQVDGLAIGIVPLTLAYIVMIVGVCLCLIFCMFEILIYKTLLNKNRLLAAPRTGFI